MFTPQNSLNFEKGILDFFGMYPEYDGPNKLKYRFKFVITLITSLIFFLSIWMKIFLNLDNTDVVIETLYFGLTQSTFISKLFNIQLRSKSFKNLLDFLALPVFNSYTEKQYVFIYNAIIKIKMFGKAFRTAVSITIVFFIIFPFIDNSLLPISSYFPIDVKRYRIFLFVFQIIGVLMNGYVHSSLDCIVCTLISIASAQFEILKDNLNNIRKGYNKNINEELIRQRLRSCVIHHCVIIKFSFQIEYMFSFVQFVQFLASSIIICVTGFQIIVTPPTDSKFITLVLYFLCNLIQVSMCCWFGHDIMTKSAGVGEACYMSDWYKCSKSVGQYLFIIMERSKRPVTLTAGKFFKLTLETLMQVLKSSYSYLALLRRMNETT